jgi:TPR repeat protein
MTRRYRNARKNAIGLLLFVLLGLFCRGLYRNPDPAGDAMRRQAAAEAALETKIAANREAIEDFDREEEAKRLKLEEDAERSRIAAEEAQRQAVARATSERMAKFFRDQAVAGNDLYQLRLGQAYLKGEGVDQDKDLARKWLFIASTNGNAEALALLQSIK